MKGIEMSFALYSYHLDPDTCDRCSTFDHSFTWQDFHDFETGKGSLDS